MDYALVTSAVRLFYVHWSSHQVDIILSEMYLGNVDEITKPCSSTLHKHSLVHRSELNITGYRRSRRSEV